MSAGSLEDPCRPRSASLTEFALFPLGVSLSDLRKTFADKSLPAVKEALTGAETWVLFSPGCLDCRKMKRRRASEVWQQRGSKDSAAFRRPAFTRSDG